MEIPCAILILAFYLPEEPMKLDAVSDGTGSTAVATLGEVRASVVLRDKDEPSSPARLEQRLCLGRACIPYAARFRRDASAVELLIAAPDGRFIRFKRPPAQIAAVSGRISYAASTAVSNLASARGVLAPQARYSCLPRVDHDPF